MFKERSNGAEYIDNLDKKITLGDLEKNLKEFEHINQWLGSSATLKNGLNKIIRKEKLMHSKTTLRIADLGCGGGDLCRTILRWAKKNQCSVQVIGIDINPDIVQYASKNTKDYPSIHYQQIDVFSDAFKTEKFDIICLNNICHHWDEKSLIQILNILARQTKIAILINDLHRHYVAYCGIIALTRILNLSYLAKHDGPLSVLRAFRRQEFERLLTLSGFTEFDIQWKWLFRWQVIIWI